MGKRKNAWTYFLPAAPQTAARFNAFRQLHGADAPALEYADGSYVWCRDGVLHRDGNAPAVVWGNGEMQAWFVDGALHRADGPALITKKKQVWYERGKRHRDGDRPAVEWTDYSKVKYYRRGMLHRDSGFPSVLVVGRYACFHERGHLHRHGGPAVVCWEHGAMWYASGRCQGICPWGFLPADVREWLRQPQPTFKELERLVCTFVGSPRPETHRIDKKAYDWVYGTNVSGDTRSEMHCCEPLPEDSFALPENPLLAEVAARGEGPHPHLRCTCRIH